MEIGESGQAYLQAIRLRGIDTDVAYFDPSSPPPPMETGQEPEPPAERADRDIEGTVGSIDVTALVFSAAVLLAIAYVFARFGGRISVSLGRDAENMVRERRGNARGTGPLAAAVPSDLASILSLQDRREALVQLAQSALASAVSANGVLLQRSWTAREALRHLPAEQNHMSALYRLVHASERVHFGGRDVSEEEFQAHIADIKPLLQSGGRS